MATTIIHLSSGCDLEKVCAQCTRQATPSKETLPTTLAGSSLSSNSSVTDEPCSPGSDNLSTTGEPCGQDEHTVNVLDAPCGRDDDTESICSWTTDFSDVGGTWKKESPRVQTPFVAPQFPIQAMPLMHQMPQNMIFVPVAVPIGWTGPAMGPATGRQGGDAGPGMFMGAVSDKRCTEAHGMSGAGHSHSQKVRFDTHAEMPAVGPNTARKGAQRGQKSVPAAAQRGGARRPRGPADMEDAFTTVIMRNVPQAVSRDLLARMLNMAGLANAYDFIHLPVELKTEKSLGYALINMTTHRNAKRVIAIFTGFDAWPVAGARGPCEVAKSLPMQGLAAHVNRYRNSPLMHGCVPEEFKPALYRGGEKVAFPAPTQRLRMPRVRYQKLAAAAFAANHGQEKDQF